MKARSFFQNRVVQHIIFWTVLLAFSLSKELNQYRNTPFFSLFANTFAEFVFQVISSYALAYYLIPRFYFRRQYLAFMVNLILLIYLSSVACRYLTIYIVEPIVRTPPLEQESLFQILTEMRPMLMNYTFPIFSMTLLFLFAKFFVDFQREREHGLLLKKEKSELELKTLKSQMNPHFLFNTLNNIYSLSIVDYVKTPVAIDRLAGILDTILFKCNVDYHPVSSEIEMVENYIELEKLRYDERLVLHIEKNIDQDNLIPPLILLSLVENAFKHGAGEDSGSPEIWISIKANATVTAFEIKNTVFNSTSTTDREGTGLANIHRQLDLLYAKNYSLETSCSKGLFRVNLSLQNAPHQ